MIGFLLWTIALIAFTVLVVVHRHTLEEKEALRVNNQKLEQTNRFTNVDMERHLHTLREQRNALQGIVTECHGIISACCDDSEQVVEQEASLTAILTECHSTLGNDVSDCFGSLYARKNWKADHQQLFVPWSSVSALQEKHADEKKVRKAENEPGWDKFKIDEEPVEPADVM